MNPLDFMKSYEQTIMDIYENIMQQIQALLKLLFKTYINSST